MVKEAREPRSPAKGNFGANVRFRIHSGKAADALCGSMDSADCLHACGWTFYLSLAIIRGRASPASGEFLRR
ncbi:MAG: hypothetical protein KatS3mg110_0476 [Pirellulaceae bacterium]|nr:MAG: hypothetical protein KatS3mg110_0476 [Pirellulaceae bacterium]